MFVPADFDNAQQLRASGQGLFYSQMGGGPVYELRSIKAQFRATRYSLVVYNFDINKSFHLKLKKNHVCTGCFKKTGHFFTEEKGKTEQ